MAALTLTKIERQQVDVMRQELTPWGLSTALVMGGKHLALKVWGRDGSDYRLVIACTPRSDGHTLNQARQKARRLVRLINERAGY
jgi:hypothetical protein